MKSQRPDDSMDSNATPVQMREPVLAPTWAEEVASNPPSHRIPKKSSVKTFYPSKAGTERQQIKPKTRSNAKPTSTKSVAVAKCAKAVSTSSKSVKQSPEQPSVPVPRKTQGSVTNPAGGGTSHPDTDKEACTPTQNPVNPFQSWMDAKEKKSKAQKGDKDESGLCLSLEELTVNPIPQNPQKTTKETKEKNEEPTVEQLTTQQIKHAIAYLESDYYTFIRHQSVSNVDDVPTKAALPEAHHDKAAERITYAV